MTKFANRAKMSISSTGTGNVTLNAAVAGYRTFAAAGIVDTDQIRYIIEDANGAWEIGIGLMSSSATVMARTVEESSNSNAALDLTSAAKVLIGITAQDFEANPAPRWTTTPASTLDLANDGSTAVTLTGVAVDENFPVRYSWDGYIGSQIYDADSLPPQLASAPVINQSTGVTSLVGSSTSSNAGTYYHRTRATDGINTTTQTTAVALGFGYNLATGSYDNKSFSYSSQESSAYGVAISADGTKIFVAGTYDTVYQYTLSVAYDASTATYSGNSFNPTQDNSNLYNVVFNPTGTKMYIVATSSNGRLFEYTLSTGFDLSSTIAYTNNNYVIGNQAYNVAFNPAGTRMFAVGALTGSNGSSIKQFNLSTGFDLSTISTTSNSFSISSQTSYPNSIALNDDGTKIFVGDDVNNRNIYEYSASTGWDASTISYSSTHHIANDLGGPAQGYLKDLVFSASGNKMYLINASLKQILQYSV